MYNVQYILLSLNALSSHPCVQTDPKGQDVRACVLAVLEQALNELNNIMYPWDTPFLPADVQKALGELPVKARICTFSQAAASIKVDS